MRREQRDPYVVLGVARQASAYEIVRAYRRAARATHPDCRAGERGSSERFQAVSDAYETLRDPKRRAAYDRAHPSVRAGDPHGVVSEPLSRPAPYIRVGPAEVVPPGRTTARRHPADGDTVLLERLVRALLRSMS
jgi:curved DNA-binding protein CbpA